MECTVCERSNLVRTTLEEGLPCTQCQQCGGSWLQAQDYQSWRQNSSEDKTADPSAIPMHLVSGESPGLKFCPHCSHILIKYKVGHHINFSIDRCGFCAGVWLDQNEWALLKAHNMHQHLYSVFSDEWQSEIRAAEHKQAMDSILKERLGDQDYQEFMRIKTWLDNHKRSDELYALLFGSAHRRASKTYESAAD